MRAYLAERGLGEEVCREFRLGLAPRGSKLVPKARAQGFTAAGARGGRASPGAAAATTSRAGCSSRWPTRAAASSASRRASLSDDDPLRAKYVNSPEGELFRKGALLYGLHAARNAIAKHGRAIVVEGNTDVLALRAGRRRAGRRVDGHGAHRAAAPRARPAHAVVFLCFDADAAGEAATLRGMELAHGQSLDVRVVALPPGSDPADEAAGFDDRLRHAEPYLLYRVRLIIERADDRQAGFDEVGAIPARRSRTRPQRQDAQRLAADMLDLPRELQARWRRTGGVRRADRVAQDAPGGRPARAHVPGGRVLDPAGAAPWAHELGDEHFDTDEHRRLRAFLAGEAGEEKETAALHAELWATAEAEGVTADQARGLALELKERWVDREIAALEHGTMTRDDERRHADLVRYRGELRDAVAALA